MAGEPAGCTANVQLMEPELALYWKTVCRHLQTEAQVSLVFSLLCLLLLFSFGYLVFLFTSHCLFWGLRKKGNDHERNIFNAFFFLLEKADSYMVVLLFPLSIDWST